MKKNILLIITILLLIPIFTKAEVKVENLNEALAAEGIKIKEKKYKESDDQAIIYLFRGQGCTHCHEFLSFLNNITSEYGKYFKVKAYEVWNNKDNDKLMEKVATYLKNDVIGVPYIIIGETAYSGYAASYNKEIIEEIKKLYNTKIEDRFDIMTKIDNTNNENNTENNNTNNENNTEIEKQNNIEIEKQKEEIAKQKEEIEKTNKKISSFENNVNDNNSKIESHHTLLIICIISCAFNFILLIITIIIFSSKYKKQKNA